MATNMKFHAIAIGAISVLVVLLYMLMGPAPEEQNVAHQPTDRFARVSSATWGLACNAQISEVRQTQDNSPLQKDADGKVIKNETMKPATVNNALDVVKKACEGQINCQIMASDEALGITLPAGCYKQLSVNYSCSDLDRLTVVNIDQGQSLKIDCMPDVAATAPNQP